MKVVRRDRLRAFGEKHADTRSWIEGWLSDVELSNWATPNDVKNRYASASFLASNIVIFNLKGNRYRLETVIAYKTKIVMIQWIGTHAEYDKRNDQR